MNEKFILKGINFNFRNKTKYAEETEALKEIFRIFIPSLELFLKSKNTISSIKKNILKSGNKVNIAITDELPPSNEKIHFGALAFDKNKNGIVLLIRVIKSQNNFSKNFEIMKTLIHEIFHIFIEGEDNVIKDVESFLGCIDINTKKIIQKIWKITDQEIAEILNKLPPEESITDAKYKEIIPEKEFTKIGTLSSISITDYHAKYYANELMKRSPSDSLEKLTGSLIDAQVDLNPHQIDAALFAFKSPLSKGVILADEVGLGKTIEAGIVLSQKWAEGKRRILIIVPSNLRKQWNQELLEKFFLESVILETKSFNEFYDKKRANPFFQNKIIICSYHFAKKKEEEIKHGNWDLIIIDEAHRLRNVYKKGNQIAKSIKEATKDYRKILLTATPLQNSLLELYGLVSCIDEHVFGDVGSFKEKFVYGAEGKGVDLEDLKVRLSPLCQRTLRKQVLEYIRYTNRIPMTHEFIPTKEEQELYDKVSSYLRRDDLQALPKGQRHLMTLIMRKLLASSTFAISGTLKSLTKKLNKIIERGSFEDVGNLFHGEYEGIDDLEDEWEEEDEIKKKLTEEDKRKISEEIDELLGFSNLAESIKLNSKGEVLQKALLEGFSKLKQLKAPQKALIFTEFRRTQEYLDELLSTNPEYKDKIVLFNGTNNDEKSLKIYHAWLEKNNGTDKMSGSKSADMRSALVDFFKEDAKIMIATEAAAEGINLQFCSLVVNYDLPWNPQRIEQRIGRCHRYGQNHDVVVINFLNRKNEADQRVFQLLSEKFKLFDGVFGASDEILGAIESGVDFEKRISKIYQECRNAEEINNSFDELQKELESQIEESMKSTRKKLLENFDQEVHEKLKVSLNESKQYLNKYEDWLWKLTEYYLEKDYASFGNKDFSFILEKTPFADITAPLGKYKLGRKIEDAHIYRMGHPIAQKILTKYKEIKLPPIKIQFDYSNYDKKISIMEDLMNKEGELALWRISIESFESEDYLIFAGLTDKGKLLNDEQCKRLFSLPAKILNENVELSKEIALKEDFEKSKKNVVSNLSERNSKFFDEELEKLNKWAEDKQRSLRISLKEIDDKKDELKKAIRNSTNLQEKVTKQKEIRVLEKKRDVAWKEYDNESKNINLKKDTLIDNIESRMEQKIKIEELFSINWSVV